MTEIWVLGNWQHSGFNVIAIYDFPNWAQSDLLNDPMIQLTTAAKKIIKAGVTHLTAPCLAMSDSVPNYDHKLGTTCTGR